ncbi:UNVERIFIED_CONTAM: hypothetical protein GTU68_035954 [Idotea baltica]|nr:hypothetical protein [Idotea baltica]
MRRLTCNVLFAILSVLCIANVTFAGDDTAAKYIELSPAVPVSKPGKIEVVELFWYGCPHCYEFEPIINPWIKSLPKDVNFVRIPAMFGGLWDVHGKLFLTLQSMGVEQKVHTAIFDAIQRQGKKLATPEDMANFVAGLGVDKDTFLSTYNSFAINSQVTQAKKLVQGYKVTGVPTLIINGKYRVPVREGVLDTANELIEKERKAMSSTNS